jgi:capsular exopolysaccharide synthesis family protein
MAKVYEALRRAEEERNRKLSGQDTSVAAVEWDTTPQTAPAGKRLRLWRRMRGPAANLETAGEMNKRRISLLEPESNVAEQYRTLRGRIDSLCETRPFCTIAVTSANAGEGKSTSSINLAIVTAMSVGRQVLLIDCDLRRPSVHKALGIEPRFGLAEILMDRASLDEAVVKVEGLNLDVLAVRAQPGNPSELLASAQMRGLIEEVSRRYDRAILDTPATLGIPDSKVITDLCDAMVMVVRADKTPREDVLAALEVLDRRRLLGMVLNGADADGGRYRYY